MKNLPIFRLFYQNKETIKLALPVFIELILGVSIGYINQFMFAGFPQATNAIGQVNQVTNIFIVSFKGTAGIDDPCLFWIIYESGTTD